MRLAVLLHESDHFLEPGFHVLDQLELRHGTASAGHTHTRGTIMHGAGVAVQCARADSGAPGFPAVGILYTAACGWPGLGQRWAGRLARRSRSTQRLF